MRTALTSSVGVLPVLRLLWPPAAEPALPFVELPDMLESVPVTSTL